MAQAKAGPEEVEARIETLTMFEIGSNNSIDEFRTFIGTLGLSCRSSYCIKSISAPK